MRSDARMHEAVHSRAAAAGGREEGTLARMHTVASIGIATHHMLEELLPDAAMVVEEECGRLVQDFMTLLAYIREQKNLPDNVNKAVSGIITGMQFQDQNTQVMHNAARVLERYRAMLEDIRCGIEALRGDDGQGGVALPQAAESILSGIGLSVVRLRYLDVIRRSGILTGDKSEPASGNQIELF